MIPFCVALLRTRRVLPALLALGGLGCGVLGRAPDEGDAGALRRFLAAALALGIVTLLAFAPHGR